MNRIAKLKFVRNTFKKYILNVYKLNFFSLKKNLFAILFFSTFWLLVVIISGSVFSGFHLVDDHEILVINHKLIETNNIITTIINTIKADFKFNRFRPVYFIHRILEVKILGTNFFAWSLYNCFLAIITSYLLFIVGRLFNFSIIESILFSLLALIGPQAAVWWRFGTNENIGMLFLALSLIFMILSESNKINKYLTNILFILCVIIMTLCKESFILILPAITFWKIWGTKLKNQLTFKKALYSNLTDTVILLSLFIIEVIFIKYYIGTDFRYAGISSSTQITKYGFTFIQLLIKCGFILILILFVFYLLDNWNKLRIKMLQKIKDEFLYLIILFFVFIIPQVVLYAKSEIYERYLLPSTLIFSFTIIYIFHKVNSRIIYRRIMLAVITIYIAFFTLFAFYRAIEFAVDGKNINAMFNKIKIKTNEKSNVLIINYSKAGNEELIISIERYLHYFLKMDNIYCYTNNSSVQNYAKISNNKNNNNFDCIMLFSNMENQFINEANNLIISQKLKKYVFGKNYILYLRDTNDKK